MNSYDTNFNALELHKSREQELLAIAENERKVKSLREAVQGRVRRIIRINNNPAR